MICGSYDPITSHCAPCCFVCSHHPKCDKKESAASATNTDSGNGTAAYGQHLSQLHYTKKEGESQHENA